MEHIFFNHLINRIKNIKQIYYNILSRALGHEEQTLYESTLSYNDMLNIVPEAGSSP